VPGAVIHATTLSGGQQQLVCLVAAILRKSDGGNPVEFESPADLLKRDSMFHALCEAQGVFNMIPFHSALHGFKIEVVQARLPSFHAIGIERNS